MKILKNNFFQKKDPQIMNLMRSWDPLKILGFHDVLGNKATPLIRRFKKRAMSYGPIDWNNLDLNQSYDELIYTPLNHNEMYYSFDVVGLDILEFIKYSKFTKEGRHKPYEWDPFEKNPK